MSAKDFKRKKAIAFLGLIGVKTDTKINLEHGKDCGATMKLIDIMVAFYDDMCDTQKNTVCNCTKS